MAKKITKLLTYSILGLLAFCLIFSLSACGLMPSTSDDTADADGDEEKREANIYDSYDDSRPNYDEEFDFESGYTPAYTPEGVPVVVTIVLPNEISLSSTYDNSIWETGMTMTMDTLPQEEDLVGYEAYSTAHDKHLIGWYVYDDEGNSYRLTSDGMYGISDTTPLTVYPLFQDNFYDLDVNDQAQNGQSTLNDMGVGSGVAYPTSTSQSNTAASFETVFNRNDFIEEQMLVYTDGLYVGNWFRINTNYRVDGVQTTLEEGKTYTASYALTNYCDEPITITLYHASNGWPYNSSDAYRARDFDKDILEMDPGETAYSTLTVTYTQSVSYNFLTPVIYGAWYNTTSFADADCESKKTGISNEGLETITDFRMGIRCHVEETEYIDVRYSLPEGVTFAQDSGYTDEVFETPVNSNLELPSGDDLVYSGAYTNQYLLEWRLGDENGNATDTVITESYRITSDCVLVPVFADKCTITIEPLDGAIFSYTTAYAAKGGTLKLPSVTLSSDADIYGYYLSGDGSQTIIGQPRDSITVTGDMTLCLKVENISTRVTVTLASGLEDVVTINSLAVEHIHTGEAGALYDAIYGDGADIEYSEYKDFGETPTWEVSTDNGLTWVTVTESYAIPSTVSSVIIRPVYSDLYITVTVDSSVEHFTLTSDSSFKVVYGDTWGQYLSDEEIENNVLYELSDGYLFAYWTVDGTAVNLEDEIPYHNGEITLVPVVDTAAEIVLELPDGVTISSDYKLPTIAAGGTISESDLPTTENFTDVENGREVIGWYAIEVSSSGKTTNVIIGDGYRISDTVTLAPYWSRVEGSYKAVFEDGSTGDPVFSNEQSTLKPNQANSTLDVGNFTAIPSRHENVYPVSAGGGYAELGTYFSYNGTMSVGDYFRVATEIDEKSNSGNGVVTVGQEHAFIYTFENIGTTDIYLSMQLVNSGTDAEGDTYKIYLKPGESIQFTIVMSFSKGSTNKNILALFTVDQEMSGMSWAASVSIVLNNTTGLTEGYVTNATDSVYAKESYTLTYVLPEGATLAGSFNEGSYSLVQIREKGIVLPTAEDIILDEGEAKYKKLTWYVIADGQETEVHEGDDFEADTTIYLKIEDIKVTVTVDISGSGDGISFSSGGTTSTFEAVYGNPWSEYLSDEALEKLGFTLEDGYSVTGWHTESWDTINLDDIVPAEDIAISPVLAYVGEVEVKLSNAYSENIVTIISLGGHVLAGEEGALYDALHGQGAMIEYNQYKDFGKYVWYVTADGSQWVEVTEDYAVPDGVTSVTVYLKYDDIKITITVDGSVENFTLTSDSTFEVTYGDTWGQYLSSGEIGNNVEYKIADGYVFGYWTVGDVKVDFDAIVPNEQGITLVPVLNKLVAIELELPNDVVLEKDFDMPELIDGDTLYATSLPTTSDFASVENGRTVAGWYVIEVDAQTGQATNVLIESSGYTIESETVTVAPYWTRVEGSYTAVFNTGTTSNPVTATGDPVFNNEQSDGEPNTVGNGLSHDSFTGIPNRYENTYPVSAGGGYAELGTYFSYTGTMSVGGTFRCTTFIDYTDAVVTKGEEHAFVYTFQNIGTTNIYLTMQLVNSSTNVEGNVYYIYLEPGESIQFTIVMAFQNGDDNHNIMAYFTVDKEMNGMSMAASVSFVLGNSSNLSEGYVTDSDEYIQVSYDLTNATLNDSFNDGRYTLIMVKGKSLNLPTAEDIVLAEGEAIYKKLTWYVYENGEYKAVTEDYILSSDTIVYLYVEDIKIIVTVDITGLEGISFGSGYTATFEAIYGQKWSEYLGDDLQEALGYILETDYSITGWKTADGDEINFTDIVPGNNITIVPEIAYEGAVEVTIADGYSDIVEIVSLDGFVHAGVAGSLYNALLGENVIINYSPYKNFGTTYTWEVSTDGGNTWETVTEVYVVSGDVSVIVRPKYEDIKITITIDDSNENFSFTADSIEVVYGDTWGDYISSSELTNYEFELTDRYVITGWTMDGVAIDLDEIIPNDVGITIVPILTKMVDILLELPGGVTQKTEYNMPELIGGDILYESDLPTIDNFDNIEYGREILGWYVIEKDSVTGQTTNVLIGSGYTIESETVTVAPYWSRVEGSYTGSFKDGKSGDLVFLNEQYDTTYGSSYKKPGTISSGLSHDNFEGIPSVYENVYPVSAGGGYAEFGTYFSYTGTMAVGEYFRCATEVDESAKVVTINEEHAFIYTFENIGATDIWLSMRLVNSGTDAEGDIYYVYLKSGESIQFTIVMAFSNGSNNNNIMVLFTVDKQMEGMEMAASVSFVLNNTTKLTEGCITNATNDVYKEKHTLTYVLPEGAHLASSFNDGSETLVQFRENGIVLPTAEDIVLSDGSDARYKKLTWYVGKDGQYSEVKGGEDFDSDTTIYLKIEDITVSVTVDFSEITGINSSSGDSMTFDAVYGNLWSEYLNESALGYTLDAGYFVAGWQTSFGEEIDLAGAVPNEDITVKPKVEYADVKISIGSVEGVTVNVTEIDAYIGANLLDLVNNVLASGTLTVDTGSDITELKGWSLADGGEMIGSDYTVGGNVTIYPVIGYKAATVTIKIEAEDVDVKFIYGGTTYTNGQSFELQATCMDDLYNLISNANISGTVSTEGFEFLGHWKTENGSVITEGTMIESVSVMVVPVISKKSYTVSIRTITDDDGNVIFSVTGYDNAYVLYGDTFSLPAEGVETITNETGKQLTGWIIKYSDGTYSVSYTYSGSDSTGSVVTSSGVYNLGDDFVMPAGDIEILPLLYESDEYIPHEIDYFDNASGSAKSDSAKNAFTAGVYYSQVTYETDYFIKLNDGYTMDDGDYIRYKNKYTVTSGTTYDFYYTITNLGATEISIKIYQMNSGANINSSGTVSAESDQVTIAPGMTVTVSLLNVSGLGEGQASGTNNNTLTIIQVINGTTDFYLGINERIDVHEDVNPASAVSTYSCEASLEEKRRES